MCTTDEPFGPTIQWTKVNKGCMRLWVCARALFLRCVYAPERWEDIAHINCWKNLNGIQNAGCDSRRSVKLCGCHGAELLNHKQMWFNERISGECATKKAQHTIKQRWRRHYKTTTSYTTRTNNRSFFANDRIFLLPFLSSWFYLILVAVATDTVYNCAAIINMNCFGSSAECEEARDPSRFLLLLRRLLFVLQLWLVQSNDPMPDGLHACR